MGQKEDRNLNCMKHTVGARQVGSSAVMDADPSGAPIATGFLGGKWPHGGLGQLGQPSCSEEQNTMAVTPPEPVAQGSFLIASPAPLRWIAGPQSPYP